MRMHEQWAIAVATVAIVSPLLQLAPRLGSQPWANFWVWAMLGHLLGRVAVGVWLYYTARRDGHSPIVWFALGAVFSILAAILYFLLRVLDRDAPEMRHGGPDA